MSQQKRHKKIIAGTLVATSIFVGTNSITVQATNDENGFNSVKQGYLNWLSSVEISYDYFSLTAENQQAVSIQIENYRQLINSISYTGDYQESLVLLNNVYDIAKSYIIETGWFPSYALEDAKNTALEQITDYLNTVINSFQTDEYKQIVTNFHLEFANQINEETEISNIRTIITQFMNKADSLLKEENNIVQLKQVKEIAINELKNCYNPSDYNDSELNEITTILNQYIENINNSKTIASVNQLKEEGISKIQGIQTPLELAKKNAISTIENYVDFEQYFESEQNQLTNIIVTAVNNIQLAETEDNVLTLLENAKLQINNILNKSQVLDLFKKESIKEVKNINGDVLTGEYKTEFFNLQLKICEDISSSLTKEDILSIKTIGIQALQEIIDNFNYQVSFEEKKETYIEQINNIKIPDISSDFKEDIRILKEKAIIDIKNCIVENELDNIYTTLLNDIELVNNRYEEYILNLEKNNTISELKNMVENNSLKNSLLIDYYNEILNEFKLTEKNIINITNISEIKDVKDNFNKKLNEIKENNRLYTINYKNNILDLKVSDLNEDYQIEIDSLISNYILRFESISNFSNISKISLNEKLLELENKTSFIILKNEATNNFLKTNIPNLLEKYQIQLEKLINNTIFYIKNTTNENEIDNLKVSFNLEKEQIIQDNATEISNIIALNTAKTSAIAELKNLNISDLLEKYKLEASSLIGESIINIQNAISIDSVNNVLNNTKVIYNSIVEQNNYELSLINELKEFKNIAIKEINDIDYSMLSVEKQLELDSYKIEIINIINEKQNKESVLKEKEKAINYIYDIIEDFLEEQDQQQQLENAKKQSIEKVLNWNIDNICDLHKNQIISLQQDVISKIEIQVNLSGIQTLLTNGELKYNEIIELEKKENLLNQAKENAKNQILKISLEDLSGDYLNQAKNLQTNVLNEITNATEVDILSILINSYSNNVEKIKIAFNEEQHLLQLENAKLNLLFEINNFDYSDFLEENKIVTKEFIDVSIKNIENITNISDLNIFKTNIFNQLNQLKNKDNLDKVNINIQSLRNSYINKINNLKYDFLNENNQKVVFSMIDTSIHSINKMTDESSMNELFKSIQNQIQILEKEETDVFQKLLNEKKLESINYLKIFTKETVIYDSTVPSINKQLEKTIELINKSMTIEDINNIIEVYTNKVKEIADTTIAFIESWYNGQIENGTVKPDISKIIFKLTYINGEEFVPIYKVSNILYESESNKPYILITIENAEQYNIDSTYKIYLEEKEDESNTPEENVKDVIVTYKQKLIEMIETKEDITDLQKVAFIKLVNKYYVLFDSCETKEQIQDYYKLALEDIQTIIELPLKELNETKKIYLNKLNHINYNDLYENNKEIIQIQLQTIINKIENSNKKEDIINYYNDFVQFVENIRQKEVSKEDLSSLKLRYIEQLKQISVKEYQLKYHESINQLIQNTLASIEHIENKDELITLIDKFYTQLNSFEKINNDNNNVVDNNHDNTHKVIPPVSIGKLATYSIVSDLKTKDINIQKDTPITSNTGTPRKVSDSNTTLSPVKTESHTKANLLFALGVGSAAGIVIQKKHKKK